MPALVFSLIYFTTASCFSHVRSETLLSIQKPSSQTITSLGRDSSKAVDGNRNADWYAGSCTLSDMVDSWWKVDLEASHLIGRIDIYNRVDRHTDEMAHLTISTSLDNTNFKVCGGWGPVIPYTFDNATVKLVRVDSCQLRMARWVKIARSTDFYRLILCEIEVYAGNFFLSHMNIYLSFII